MVKHITVLFIALLYAIATLNAQVRIVDAGDKSPISAASVFDASGSMVGITLSDGTLSYIPKQAYPITVRSMGYSIITIESPENRTWEMAPVSYELDEVVIVPADHDVMKQIFYAREYFSMHTKSDTINFFTEYMVQRFIPAGKDSKFKSHSEFKILSGRYYSHINIQEIDSVEFSREAIFPSMLSMTEVSNKPVEEPESFKQSQEAVKRYEEQGKSGPTLIVKQNAHSFITIEDALAYKKNHKWSPVALKIFGLSLEATQMYFTHVYRTGESGVYYPADLTEAGFVMEANGGGKYLRKMFGSDEQVIMRSTVELYAAGEEYYTAKGAKEEKKKNPTDIEFIVPDNVPPLNAVIERMVRRAHAENNK